uniref:Uncharacterized protein n=1 Tax=Timema cristinae TaxID=61476 RepID=A0A7R9CSI3_TIMCR|nr:unnamed protein product [Timema cristinae]
MTSTLTVEQDRQLQLFLVRRLRKGAIYTGTGNFSGMDFSLGDMSHSPAVCFYILLLCGTTSIGSPRQIVICLLSTGESNLEVFRPELTQFCEGLAASMSSVKEISSLSGELCRWHSVCIMYVCRVLEMLGANVAFLLQLAQQNGRLRTEDDKEPRLAEDIQRFLSACTVAECLGSQPSQPPVALFREGEVRGLEVNAYCRDWGLLLLEHSHSAEPWRIRRAMEAFKLKAALLSQHGSVSSCFLLAREINKRFESTFCRDSFLAACTLKTIKDMNVLKRLLKQAEMDHYSLYRAYSFLWQSGNSDVLLNHAKTEGSSAPDVIAALEEHLSTVSGAA